VGRLSSRSRRKAFGVRLRGQWLRRSCVPGDTAAGGCALKPFPSFSIFDCRSFRQRGRYRRWTHSSHVLFLSRKPDSTTSEFLLK